jgi:hypothetical protein
MNGTTPRIIQKGAESRATRDDGGGRGLVVVPSEEEEEVIAASNSPVFFAKQCRRLGLFHGNRVRRCKSAIQALDEQRRAARIARQWQWSLCSSLERRHSVLQLIAPCELLHQSSSQWVGILM